MPTYLGDTTTNKQMEDGFPTTIDFTNIDSTLIFEEVVINLPGVSGNGSIPLTSMRNSAFTTQLAKKLKTISQLSFSCKYNTKTFTAIMAFIGQGNLKNGKAVINFPGTAKQTYWGFFTDASQGSMAIGGLPIMNVVFDISNLDTTTTPYTETGPAWSAS